MRRYVLVRQVIQLSAVITPSREPNPQTQLEGQGARRSHWLRHFSIRRCRRGKDCPVSHLLRGNEARRKESVTKQKNRGGRKGGYERQVVRTGRGPHTGGEKPRPSPRPQGRRRRAGGAQPLPLHHVPAASDRCASASVRRLYAAEMRQHQIGFESSLGLAHAAVQRVRDRC